jgi:hypothetical protein
MIFQRSVHLMPSLRRFIHFIWMFCAKYNRTLWCSNAMLFFLMNKNFGQLLKRNDSFIASVLLLFKDLHNMNSPELMHKVNKSISRIDYNVKEAIVHLFFNVQDTHVQFMNVLNFTHHQGNCKWLTELVQTLYQSCSLIHLRISLYPVHADDSLRCPLNYKMKISRINSCRF